MRRKIGICLLVTSTLLSGCCTVNMPNELVIREGKEHTWDVEGQYETKVKPDIAEVTFNVYTEDMDATKCQQLNTDIINKVTEALSQYGIKDDDIQTSDFYLDRKEDRYQYEYYRSNLPPKEEEKDLGYEMNSKVEVTNIPVDKAGDIMTLVVENGANEIKGLRFKTTKYDEAYLDAMKLALKDSRKKADALAEAAGCKIVGIQDVSDNSSYSPYRAVSIPETYNSNSAEKASGVKGFNGQSTEVKGGELDIKAKVTVTYLIE